MRAWTATDVAKLRAAYSTGGIAAARAALPDRSVVAICHKAQVIGVRRKRKAWTADDYAKLRRLWTPESSLAEIARALQSTPKTVYWVSRKLKLPQCPDGFEFVTAAAQRCGYRTEDLLPILKAEGVRTYAVLARPSKRRGRRTGKRNAFRVVWIEDVDRAVADWLKRENASEVERRLYLSDGTLAKRLRLAGVKKVSRKKRSHWRLRDEDVERALSVKMVRTRGARGRFTGARFEAPTASSTAGAR